MNNPEQLTVILTYALIAIVIILFVLLIAFAVAMIKNKQKQQEEKQEVIEKTEAVKKAKTSLGENKQSIHKFMEFDTVDDNMIIQDNGRRFLMVVECQGINYDLMSGVEKAAVEDGFVQFLNTLRNPIQIYVQTRTVNLESSIQTYKNKLNKIEDKLNIMKMSYDQMLESEEYTKEQLDKAYFELTKQTNLYEYGKDIINNTERMSLNKNILNKKYYIVVQYYASELGSNDLDKEEIQNLVFSELYTRAQSLITSISSCGVRGKILRTNELIELLYMAYNREEAETFGLDKAMQAGYDSINSTAPDVLDKKMKEINKYIEQKAMETAKEVVDQVMNEKAQRVANKEENMDALIMQMAETILRENEAYIGEEVIEESLKKIEESKNTVKKKVKRGGKLDGEKN